jgi:hypothetical protein
MVFSRSNRLLSTGNLAISTGFLSFFSDLFRLCSRSNRGSRRFSRFHAFSSPDLQLSPMESRWRRFCSPSETQNIVSLGGTL